MPFVRAVAIDLDGTLAEHDRVEPAALRAIDEVRDEGVAVILATGRILEELDAGFPGLDGHFDAIVGENGCVLRTALGVQDLAPAIDESLRARLETRGVRLRRGRRLLAGDGVDGEPVLAAITELGLDCQLIRNRGALMVLPAGVSKGTGLHAALGVLGISVHNAIAVGDAENDLALLAAAEAGVAVANAVPSVRAHADLILDAPAGRGVGELLRGPVLSGARPLRPARRRLPIGTFEDGTPATIFGAQANVLVSGQSGAGKSYLAGLMAEQWIGAAYNVLIVDMEGDYIGLERLPDVIVFGAHDHPDVRELLPLLRRRSTSVVLDLSSLGESAKANYLQTVPALVEADRTVSGVPHWILVDEAHVALGENGVATRVFHPADRGYCLVTYRPEELARDALAFIDVTVEALGSGQDGALRARLTERGRTARDLSVAPRVTPHRRHWHKYAATPLPVERRFDFRDTRGEVVATAADLASFVALLEGAEDDVIAHHLRSGDFSRWITGTLQDRGLAALVAAIEREVRSRRTAELQRTRQAIVEAIEGRYLLRVNGSR